MVTNYKALLSTEENKTQTPFERFIQQYNESYVMKCKELGLKNEYTLESNNTKITFTRNRLTTKQFNELEQARQKSEKEKLDNALDLMDNAKREANIYLQVAQAYLKNKDTGNPITKEEYENCIWEDVKMVLDACHLRTVLGVGN
jgi:hypothetical protein